MTNRLADIDQALEKAFALAYFIHGDDESARRIVVGAMSKLQVATATQNKRLHYSPHGRRQSERSTSVGFRNKVSFSELHLLQRLIYIESEPYEIQKEQARGAMMPRQEDVLVHFIKHLVRIGLKRNSFYVTLGLSRLLYNYSTAETMEVYNLVVQDPNRVKDDYYYRSRKGILLNELKERFGNLIGADRGPRGEARLHTENSSERYAALVRRCLSLFVPWSTACSVPESFDPVTQDIPALKYHDQRSEGVIEVNRIHAVLHPGCLERLTSALRLDSAAERLAVPHFFLTQDEGDEDPPRDDLHREPALDKINLNTIKAALAEQANRRRKIAPTVLRIMVDGTEQARVDLKHARQASFQLQRVPELIEVRARDDRGDEILLASHLIAYEEMKPRFKPLKTSITTEGNQRISISVVLSQDDTGEVAGGQVEVKYEERNPFRAIALFSARLMDRLKEGLGDQGLAQAPALKFVLFLILIAAGVAGVVWYWNRVSPGTPTQVTIDHGNNDSAPVKKEATPAMPQEAIGTQAPTPDVNQPTTPLTADKSVAPTETSSPPPREERIARRPSEEGAPITEPSDPGGEKTRSPTGEPDAVSLAEVRKVHIEVTGVEPLAGEMRRLVRQHLQTSNRLSIMDSRNEADAVLKITVNRIAARSATDRISILARLVNARGEVLWLAGRRGPFVIQGDIAQAAARIGKTLLSDLQR